VIRFWFQIPMQGSLVLLYCCLIGFTTAAVGLGLSISALSLNMQAMLYTFIVIMPMMLLSGMVTPVRNMPRVLQVATMVNPLRFGIDMARRIYLEGPDCPTSRSISCRWRQSRQCRCRLPHGFSATVS
jgi:ABC-2 type transport system permease protein